MFEFSAVKNITPEALPAPDDTRTATPKRPASAASGVRLRNFEPLEGTDKDIRCG